jgi:hypothetical protein
MEKQGFIYIWFDRKRKMYYIGCHWGTEYDGYICSSNRMREAYKNRPHDFKRRIIQKNIPRESLLEEEYKWLSLIPDREIGKQYYNHSKKHFGHWITKNDDEIRAKCGAKNKGRKHNLSEEQRKERGRRISESKERNKDMRISLGLPVRQPEKVSRPPRGPQSEELKMKKSMTMKQKFESGEWKSWSAGKTLNPRSEETKQKQSLALKGKKRTDAQKKTISDSNRKAWAEGKFAARGSNNMKDYMWVRRKSDNTCTRIKKELFNDTLYIAGR